MAAFCFQSTRTIRIGQEAKKILKRTGADRSLLSRRSKGRFLQAAQADGGRQLRLNGWPAKSPTASIRDAFVCFENPTRKLNSLSFLPRVFGPLLLQDRSGCPPT